MQLHKTLLNSSLQNENFTSRWQWVTVIFIFEIAIFVQQYVCKIHATIWNKQNLQFPKCLLKKYSFTDFFFIDVNKYHFGTHLYSFFTVLWVHCILKTLCITFHFIEAFVVGLISGANRSVTTLNYIVYNECNVFVIS